MSKVLGPPPWLVTIVGAKASGKTELIRYLCYQYATDFQAIIVISPTSLNGFYQKFLPEAHIHSEYDPALIEKILERQEKLKSQGKISNVLLIMDDILSSQTTEFEKKKANVLSKLWSANRHWHISVVFVTQRLRACPKMCRENSDWVLICRTMRSAWDDIHDEFGTMDKREFYKFLEDGTRDYGILRYKANVSDSSEHYSGFRLPSEFINHQFRLKY